jgi:hypothetical protein
VKLADIGTLVWLIIAVMVVLAKSWSKFQKQIDEDTSESKEEAPPIAPVQRRPTMREGTRALQPQPRKLSGQPRPVAPVPRTAQPSQRPVPRTAARPVGSPAPREGWRIDPEKIRRFVEQLSGQPPSTPQPPVAPPPIHKAASPAPTPQAEPAAALPATKPAMADVPAPSTTSRASQWAEALRDRQNIRNIIISAEIIGPPKSL